MAKSFPALEPAHTEFIAAQHIFFVASAANGSTVNCSPKPAGALRVLSPNAVAYLDLTGSGNETAAHAQAGGNLTFMFCSFDGAALILRLYGRGRIAPRGSDDYAALLAAQFGGDELPGARQIVILEIARVQASCGYGVPRFRFTGDRDTLIRYAERKVATHTGAIRAH